MLWLQGPRPDARIVYIDGAFDLFHAGHVEVCGVPILSLSLCSIKKGRRRLPTCGNLPWV